MRKFFMVGLMPLFGYAAFAGCSVEATSAGTDEPEAGTVNAAPDATSAKDSTTDSTPDASKDSSTKKDGSSLTDATPPVDAAPDVAVGPAPGSDCVRPGDVFQQRCGLCGTQEAICEANKKVSVYSPCTGAVVDGCNPGTTRNNMCGFCGTQSQICQNDCKWASGVCMNEVTTDPCIPNEVRFTTAGCTVPDTARSQVCTAACQFGLPTTCGPVVSPTLTIASTLTGAVNADFDLAGSMESLDSDACPGTLSGENTAFVYVKLVNPTNQIATVSVWHSKVTTEIDTIMAWYNRTSAPVDTAGRLACTGEVGDTCLSAPCPSAGDWAGLTLVGTFDNRVKIPANGSVILYNAGYDSTQKGKFKLNARTDVLQ